VREQAAIALTYWHLAHQDTSAWTLDIDARPFKEKLQGPARPHLTFPLRPRGAERDC